MSEPVDRTNIVNVNVGILGHVDSGKTSLVKALSTLLSTAALDKNPQSQQRGITLDLGFSAFTLPMPDHLKEAAGEDKTLLQFTLVDCPGHASLIRTIIGGAQIIDMMILVVDANKGIQTQTAECIVIGEITTDKLIVVLNKIDMIPEAERELRLQKVSARIRKVFAATKFANSPIIATAAAVGGEKVASIGALSAAASSSRKDKEAVQSPATLGVSDLVDLIRNTIEIPRRTVEGPFYFAIDHCFAIKGHGTVLTGTVLSGSVGLNSTIELPELQQQRKVKSMQMFRKSVKAASQGDRVALCVTNLDPKLIERGIAVTPGTIPLLSTVICLVKKVRFFRSLCKSGGNYHISIGHSTVTATVTFYGAAEISATTSLQSVATSTAENVLELDQLSLEGMDSRGSGVDVAGKIAAGGGKAGEKNSSETDRQSSLNASYQQNFPHVAYPWDEDFEYQDALRGSEALVYGREPVQWALIQFQHPVYCPLGSLIIGSRLDAFSVTDVQDGSGSDGSSAMVGEHSRANQCRLAFYGPVRESVSVGGRQTTAEDLKKIRIFNWKQKEALVFKQTDVRNGLCYELLGWQLVREGGSIQPFVGMKIQTERGYLGTIVGPFGAGGKFKVKFTSGVKISNGSKLYLRYKRYIHDKLKVMAQDGIEEDAMQKQVFHDSLKNISVSDGTSRKPKKEKKEKKKDQGPAGGLDGGDTTVNAAAGKMPGTLDAPSSPAAVAEAAAVPVPVSIPLLAVPSTAFPPAAPDSSSSVITSSGSSSVICSNDCTSETIRVGTVESVKPEDGTPHVVAIVVGAFRMEENIRVLTGAPARVCGSTGDWPACQGALVGPFAKMGKCKVRFPSSEQSLVVGSQVEIFIAQR